MKKAYFSNCRNEKDRSKKNCVCGSHSKKAKKKKKHKRNKITDYLEDCVNTSFHISINKIMREIHK